MADSLYVSYAWKAEEQNRLVDRLEAACLKRNITLERDRNRISYGKSIRAFMDEIGRGRHVALVLSDAYFRSRYCMYELREINRHGGLTERVHPIVLRGTSLEPEDRVQYLKHWENKEATLDAELSSLRRRKTRNLNDAVDDYGEFRDQLDELLETLGNMNYLTEGIHVDTDFAALFDRLKPPRTGAKPFLRHRIPDPEFRQRIVQEIRLVLAGNKALADEIGEAIKGKHRSSPADPAAFLCAGDMEVALDELLRPAVQACHKRLTDPEFENLWEDAKAVLGWLCLLAVDDDWVQQRESSAADDLGLEMVVQTAFTVEIVSARYRQFRPRPIIIAGNTEVGGAGAIAFPSAADSLNADHALDTLLLAIWKRVFPESSAGTLSDKDLKNLNATLAHWEKHKEEHFYIPIPRQDHHPLCRKEFYEKLLSKLPAITLLLFTGSGEGSALRVEDEFAFMVAVREFLALRQKLAPKPKP